ncbi:hypothetical protein GCM10011344_38950 [Dokdonia pacifica]|uniref:Uncharacterized protein n=1 Tax=Dokdonia pacifica TaxID=1627892 RepID=A0A239A0N8_9FLAO|nr:hypothetical protein [Dokdonia pacifica]GGG34368.1 hypothetical protein GCM10011344_38950 [Dokdonia pacifica]SNR89246.1 hypothetical protein SAMN06265376_10474 [Dokdonia pacifica]
MKKLLKQLTLDKEVISNLDLNQVKGGGSCNCNGNNGEGPTQGPLFSCPPPGVQCY